MLAFLAIDTRAEVVKNMEVALAARRDLAHSRSLKVVLDRLQSFETSAIGELEFCVVSVPRGIVVVHSVGVTKRLEDELFSSIKLLDPCTYLCIRDLVADLVALLPMGRNRNLGYGLDSQSTHFRLARTSGTAEER